MRTSGFRAFMRYSKFMSQVAVQKSLKTGWSKLCL